MGLVRSGALARLFNLNSSTISTDCHILRPSFQRVHIAVVKRALEKGERDVG